LVEIHELQAELYVFITWGIANFGTRCSVFLLNMHAYAGVLLLYADPYGITNKRKRKEVNVESFYSDRIPLSVWHEVKGSSD